MTRMPDAHATGASNSGWYGHEAQCPHFLPSISTPPRADQTESIAMMYLWLQILFSLLAAAIVGGVVAYWWIKRRYEDVTESYESTISQSQASASGLTREDLNASLTSLKSSVSSIEMPDVKPLHARLGVIENRLNEPVNEMRGLSQRMNEIDGALAMLKLSISELRNTDLDPMENQIASLSRLVEGCARLLYQGQVLILHSPQLRHEAVPGRSSLLSNSLASP